jgi:hypothetical protein
VRFGGVVLAHRAKQQSLEPRAGDVVVPPSRRLGRSGLEITRGNPNMYKSLWSRRDDVTLANPFGPPVRGGRRYPPGSTSRRATIATAATMSPRVSRRFVRRDAHQHRLLEEDGFD